MPQMLDEGLLRDEDISPHPSQAELGMGSKRSRQQVKSGSQQSQKLDKSQESLKRKKTDQQDNEDPNKVSE